MRDVLRLYPDEEGSLDRCLLYKVHLLWNRGVCSMLRRVVVGPLLPHRRQRRANLKSTRRVRIVFKADVGSLCCCDPRLGRIACPIVIL